MAEDRESDQARQQRHRATGQLFSQVPALAQAWAQGYQALRFDRVPFTPLHTPLPACRVALVTTGGVHRRDQLPFTMADSRGDATYRRIPAATPDTALTVTHDYYNHDDVRRDVNILFPRALLRGLAQRGRIGSLADCYSFMGHIEPPHRDTLITQTAPEVAAQLRQEHVDAVLLTPA
jgi:D-proline reductase (dithiol) PrdB